MNSLISSKDWTISKDLPILCSWEGFCTAVNSMLCVSLPAISLSLSALSLLRGILTILTSVIYFEAWIKSKELPTFFTLKGFSAVGVLWFPASGCCALNAFPHSSQSQGTSPVWVPRGFPHSYSHWVLLRYRCPDAGREMYIFFTWSSLHSWLAT